MPPVLTRGSSNSLPVERAVEEHSTLTAVAAEADRLINRRNGAWVEFMIGVLPTASIIAVVGAGHLPGEKGVINLLRKAGYKVEPADTL